MVPIDAGSPRELLDAMVSAFSVLGGAMAYTSGFLAAEALARKRPPDILAQRVNEGIGKGFIAIFTLGAPAWILLPTTWAGLTLHIAMSSWVDSRHERWR